MGDNYENSVRADGWDGVGECSVTGSPFSEPYVRFFPHTALQKPGYSFPVLILKVIAW